MKTLSLSLLAAFLLAAPVAPVSAINTTTAAAACCCGDKCSCDDCKCASADACTCNTKCCK